MDHRPPSAKPAVPVWLGVVLVAAVLMLARPYVGLRHDGVLYLGQVLLRWDRPILSHDLFFQYGSQDDFTVAPALFAELYRFADVAHVQIVLVLLAQLATLRLADLFLRDGGLSGLERWLGLVAICTFSHFYGGFGVFSFSERLVTGRLLAEPAALLGLWLAWKRSVPVGLATIAASAALHPLIALPVLVVAWVLACMRNRRWVWLAALGVPAVVALAAVGVRPFDALLQTFDATWWKPVSVANLNVFIGSWPLVDWLVFAVDVAILVTAARLMPADWGQLPRAMLCAAVLLMTVSAIGADLLHDVLITQLQLWRIHWVMHLFAVALVPWLLLRAWRVPDWGTLLALAGGAALVASNARFQTGWVFAAWAALVLWLSAARPAIGVGLRRAAVYGTTFALVGVSAVAVWQNASALLRSGETVSTLPMILVLAFTMPSLVLPLAYGALLAAGRRRALTVGIAAALGLAAVYGASAWDRRSSWTRYIETGLTRSHPFAAYIPPTAQVYWGEEVAAVWMLLRRPSYLSEHQGAGLLFNRRTALEYERRRALLAPIKMQHDLCEMLAGLDVDGSQAGACFPTEPVVEHLCRAEGGPDFAIFDRRLPRGVVAQWTFSAPRQPDRTFYLYDCKHLR